MNWTLASKPHRTTLAILLAAANPALRGETPAPTSLTMEVTPPDFRLEFFPQARIPGQRPLVLALGGGAAKGIAHLGVLQRLQEEGIPVAGIAGTSMGALMGSMYAAGYSGFAVQRMLEDVDMGAMLLDRQRRAPGETLWEQEHERASLLHFEFRRGEEMSFGHGSASDLNLKRVLQVLLSRGVLQSQGNFDSLRAPFRAVSTNLETGRPYAPGTGDLSMAVRASMSVPGLLRPVLLNGQQHVDGLLVQNLPVETARNLIPQAVVVAVEVGKPLDRVRQNSIFEVALRSLDASVEGRTELSRSASDLLLRPRTETIPYLEFHRSVKTAVQAGRRAFDEQLDLLETRIYGPQVDLPVPCGNLQWEVPAGLRHSLEDLAKTCLTANPLTRRPFLRLLRRIQASGLVGCATVQFLPDKVLIQAESQTAIREVRVQAPPEWEPIARAALADAALVAGEPFNPVHLGQAMDGLFLRATLMGRPLLDAQGTAFDPATGTLILKLDEWIPGSLRIAEGTLSQRERRQLQKVFRPFEGKPLEARGFTRQVLLAERRLGLEELQVEADTGDGGFGLLARPVPDRRLVMDGILAFETTYRVHGAVEASAHHLLDTDLGFRFQASNNRLWQDVSLGLAFPVGEMPSLAGVATVQNLVQRFVTAPGLLPREVRSYAGALVGRNVRTRTAGAGITARVGMEDRGAVTLEASRTWADLAPSGENIPLPDTNQVQARFEWDSFDRYLFPTEGTLLRMRLGEGRADSTSGPQANRTFQFAYARIRRLEPLGSWGSLEGDLESGLGRSLPVSRWYRTGGPAFLSGSTCAEFFSPNFAVLRLGLPIRVFSAFGVAMQVVPRLDGGYLGSGSYRHIREGALVRGAGVSLRAEVGRWFAEFASGTWSTAGQPGHGRWGVNVLLGTHPFDLWR